MEDRDYQAILNTALIDVKSGFETVDESIASAMNSLQKLCYVDKEKHNKLMNDLQQTLRDFVR